MSSRLTFGAVKRIVAILIAIAIVLGAGLVVFQAPALFGVEVDPEASVEFGDQERDGDHVVIDEVSLSDGGYVVITDGGDEPLAVSGYLGSGTHENVTVERPEDAEEELVGQLTATVHQDTSDEDGYAYEETDGQEDRPYLEGGFPVADTATVTTGDDEGLSDSFAVDAISAPTSATTNETIEVTAEVSNPTDLETQQNVDFRLDGVVLERRVLGLDVGESQEITFEIDTRGTAPGERTIGIYTDADGEQATIDFEFHTDPAIVVVDANDEGVVADVATPADGFVAVENDTGDLVAISDEFGPGEHNNVTAEFDENATVEDDEELTAVVYEGDPDEPDAATPLEHEEEAVETTFTIADVAAEDEEDGADGENAGEDDGNGEDADDGSDDE